MFDDLRVVLSDLLGPPGVRFTLSCFSVLMVYSACRVHQRPTCPVSPASIVATCCADVSPSSHQCRKHSALPQSSLMYV